MILAKMNKILIILAMCFLTQCYTEPFFELTVKVVDQNLNPVANVAITIEVVDVENGTELEGAIIDFYTTTNSQGESSFSFDNKAFVTARGCLAGSWDDGLPQYLCKEGQVYLEANLNKELTLMLESSNDCSYCLK